MKVLTWIKKRKRKNRLSDLLRDFELPSFPDIALDALSILRDNNASMRDVANVLQRDPGIHVRILRAVNSAAYGLSTKVGNIHHAVTLLGRSRIESLLLSHAVKKSLPPVNLSNFNRKKFWLTASRRANLAYLLSDYIHPTLKDEAFTVGLLQDMGVPAIASVHQEEYNELLGRLYSSSGVSLVELEKDMLGIDHQEVGSAMAEEWNLPEYIANSIRQHHFISQNDKDLAIRLVSGIKENYDVEDVEDMIDEWTDVIHMDREKLKGLVRTAFERAEDFFRSFY